MKQTQNHNTGRKETEDRISVRFEFIHPTAKTVSVAGTFNDWKPGTKVLHRNSGGHWIKDTLLSPGNYEYCMVVDGEWMQDPAASESVPNPFGGRNSIVSVRSTTFQGPQTPQGQSAMIPEGTKSAKPSQ